MYDGGVDDFLLMDSHSWDNIKKIFLPSLKEFIRLADEQEPQHPPPSALQPQPRA